MTWQSYFGKINAYGADLPALPSQTATRLCANHWPNATYYQVVMDAKHTDVVLLGPTDALRCVGDERAKTIPLITKEIAFNSQNDRNHKKFWPEFGEFWPEFQKFWPEFFFISMALALKSLLIAARNLPLGQEKTSSFQSQHHGARRQ